MSKRIVLIGVFLVALSLAGCVHYQNILPVGEGKYMIETKMEWVLGMNEQARFKVMDKLAKTECLDYEVVSKSQRYDTWGGSWILQWVIQCPE